MSTHPYRKWIIVGAVALLGVVIALVALLGVTPAPRRSASQAPNRRPQHVLKPRYSPSVTTGGESPQQQADNAKIAAGNQGKGALWAEVETLTPPPPAASASFPSIPHATRQGSDTYAAAFVTQLLNIDFATQARPALLSWAVSETSPDTMPGTPTSAASKVLYSNLIASDSPVPTATGWAANVTAGITWSVSNVTMTSAPIWTEALATGWQPPDPRMDGLDVTGNLTVTQTGQPPVVKPFSLQLVLGTAEYYNGYGAMSVNNWTVG